MKKAIIIGASSGIGRELAFVLSQNNYKVGIAARRTEMLNTLKEQIKIPVYVSYMDVSKQDEAIIILDKLIKEMGGIDLIVINAGIGYINNELDWKKEQETIEVNVAGFTALADVAFKYFEKKGNGHITAISSIASLRGNAAAPAYSASKAYISNYLEGLRIKSHKENLQITITDIQAGFVDTQMAQSKFLFWVATPIKAAKQIYLAIKKKKKRAYVTKRWALIAFLFKILPDFIFYNL